jgi:hypothetical protein
VRHDTAEKRLPTGRARVAVFLAHSLAKGAKDRLKAIGLVGRIAENFEFLAGSSKQKFFVTGIVGFEGKVSGGGHLGFFPIVRR